MPSSAIGQLSTIMGIIHVTRPQSVLDIGIGFGKYGFLCREYLELWDGRNKYDDWQHRIDGIEAHSQYVTDLQRKIYSNMYVGDVRSVLPTLDAHYDLILMIDVIEHLSIEEGHRILSLCREKANACLIATPHVVTSQGDAFDNPFERHVSAWTQAEFERYPRRAFLPNQESLICYLRFDDVNVVARV